MTRTLALVPPVENPVPEEQKKIIYSIGVWTLNTHTNQLIQANRVVDLEHRLTSLLVFLLQHRNKVLSKDDILKVIWQSKVVNDDSLAVAISQLRKALDDNPRAPTYIKTIPGVGYQFILQQEMPLSPVIQAKLPLFFTQKKPIVSAIAASVLIGCSCFFLAKYPRLLSSSATNLLSASGSSSPVESERRLFERASALLTHHNKQELLAAIPLFRQLIVQHPQSAEAYLGIAEAKIQLLGEQVSELDNDTEIKALLEKALALNPNLARAHMWLGHLLVRHDHNFRAAEDHFKTSIALNPNDDLAHFLYEQFLLIEKRFDEAKEQIALARNINPLSYPYTYLVWVYLLEKKYDLAAQELDRIASTELEDAFFHTAAQNVYYGLEQEQKVFEHMQWFFDKREFSQQKKDSLVQEFQHGGLKAVYAMLLEQKEMSDVGQYPPPLSWARYAVALGKNQLALDYLDEAYKKRQFRLLCATTDPRYDPLRHEPRFQQLLQKLTKTVD